MQRIMKNRQITFTFDDVAETSLPQTCHGPRVSVPLRPIHYLGSKLRIVDLVREVVDRVDASGGPVCDLFAGSGTVSRELSTFRSVVAVDIQEYSRVLCSALLKPPCVKKDDVTQFLNKALSSEHARRLSWAIEPMVSYEASCRHQAEIGNVEPLCQLFEYASIISFEHGAGHFKDAVLSSALNETVSRLRKASLVDTPSAMTTRYFGGIYFSYLQASQIDMLLEAVSSLSLSERDIFLAAVLSTASEVVNTVGKQFAQPIRPRFADGRPKPNLYKRFTRDRTIDATDAFTTWIARYLAVQPSVREHRVIRSDYADALDNMEGQVSVVYADPPYTRDHYSRYYHVLETLCLRDCPSVSTVRIDGDDRMSRGIYRTGRYQSPFCIKSKAPYAFSTLFAKVRCLKVPLVLSYSPFEKKTGARPRLMAIKDIVELSRKSFSSVEVIPAGRISHSKLNRSDMNKAVSLGAETFIICKP
ncbi:MAG: DNA adenine methylase [Desulfobaccales bacterium]|jgi:adenine-specific DNA methylase